jgi:hypothetical protein
MPALPATSAEDVIDQPARTQIEVFLDEHRAALHDCLDGLTEEQARRSLVPSQTTLPRPGEARDLRREGVVRRGVTCRSRADIGIPATPDESFVLGDEDTIATVQRRTARRARHPPRDGSLGMDDIVHGNRRGPLPLRWVYFHMLRELAQHCGHARHPARAAAGRVAVGETPGMCPGVSAAGWRLVQVRR